MNVVRKEKESIYIRPDDDTAFHSFCRFFYDALSERLPMHHHEVVILCIGTDRATGDSLGPLIGYKLMNLNLKHVTIFGTLEDPVHAKNLHEIIHLIEEYHSDALIIAIDASLGRPENVGSITLGEGSIKPGSGVQKNLPEIGDLHITGIVNLSSFMNMSILQNTRLSTVMKMADMIASAMRYCLWKYYKTL